MAFGDIVLLKDQTPRGPFTRAQIQAGLSRGEFSPRDLAHTPGLRDWLPLLEVLHHLDRETVHWPRSREGRQLPPLPGTQVSTASEPAPPVVLPDVPQADVLSSSSLPPPISRFEPIEEKAATKSEPPVLPILPLSETREPMAARPQPPALPAATHPGLVPAPLGKRALAFLIDVGVLFLPLLAVFGFAYGVGLIRGSIEHRDPETARQEQALLWRNLRDLVLLVANGFAWIYAAGLESSRWQGTVGKQAMGIIVTDGAGERLGFLRATGRHAAKYLSALPFFLGFMAALVGPQRLAWHDRLAGTRVAKRTNSR
jgi:uncharacterized RDD family membrane protein YckC